MTDKLSPQPHFYLKISGSESTEDIQRQLLALTVDLDFDQPAMATITLNDTQLHWIDQLGLKPGEPVEVLIDEPTGKARLFTGEIVGVEPAFNNGVHHLTLRCFDRLHRLSRGKKSKTWVNASDTDILTGIAGAYGLSLESELPAVVYPHVYQHNQTDLEFVRTRASRYGLGYLLNDKVLTIKPPAAPGPELALEWGKGLQAFAPRLTTAGQVDAVTVRGWDPKERREVIGKAANSALGNAGGQNGAQAAKAAHGVEAEFVIDTSAMLTQDEADAIARAKLDSLALKYITAEGTAAGNPAIKPGVRLTVSAVGERFSGKYLVTGASHRYSATTGYTVTFRCAHNPSSGVYALLTGIGANPGNHAPPVNVAIGIVTDNQDPEDLGRVKVKFPTIADTETSWWARVAAPGGGAERGMQFIPEVNDEVLVGFPFGELSIPVVIGGLYNGIDRPPLKTGDAIAGGKVEKRVIKSRTGHTVTLDDAPSGGGITIEDPKGNKIFLDTKSNSLLIEVQRDIEIKAQGNIRIAAQGQLEITAAAGAKVESSATLDLKGALVNLN